MFTVEQLKEKQLLENKYWDAFVKKTNIGINILTPKEAESLSFTLLIWNSLEY